MNETEVATPRPGTVRIQAVCDGCEGEITKTAPETPWYHRSNGNEACYAEPPTLMRMPR